MSDKRNRSSYSIKDKREICEYKQKNPKATNVSIMSWFKEKHGRNLPRATVSEILKEKEKWLAMSVDFDKAKKLQSGRYADMENALYMWFCKVRNKGAIVSDDILIEKARVRVLILNITVKTETLFSNFFVANIRVNI